MTHDPELSPAPIRHAVVIATCDRWELLPRALQSIAAQTRAPDRLVLVVDGGVPAHVDVRGVVVPDGLDVAVELLANRRTRGAAGAWNTALDHLARTEARLDGLVVSFLDDDDWWEPDHVAHVDEIALRGAEVIATPLVRHDDPTPAGRRITPPEALCATDFFVGNPGVQCSNLSARLSTLLEAGCFDEALSSATDRDLCIRFADIGAAYSRAPRGAAHHDTLHGHARLSDAGSRAKLAGLDVFFGKHGLRMSQRERAASEQRARELFGWEPSSPPESPRAPLRAMQTTGPLALVIGVIVDGSSPARATPLLDDLARLRRHARVTRLDVVLVENGAANGFDHVLQRGRDLGLPLWPVRVDAQRAVAEEIGVLREEIDDRKSIAVARSLLHQFTFEVARIGEEGVAWILDDDARITGDLDLLVDDIVRAQRARIDVLIGGVSGAPPIPAAAATRMQLVDLHGFLRGAAQQGPSAPLPDAKAMNDRLREARRDYYHDLARSETDRLETTFLPEIVARDLASATSQVLARSERILAGEQLFRPIPAPHGDPLAHTAPSSLRGGNTVVFDLTLLRDIPNLSPRVAGRRLRRSDMIWAAIARFSRGRNVVSAPLVVEHDRSSDPIDGIDHEKLVGDLVGYAFFRAFEERLAKSAREPFSNEDRSVVRARTRKYAIERLSAYRLSFHRVRGITRAFDRLLDSHADERPWWLSTVANEAALRALVERLRSTYTHDALHAVERDVLARISDPGLDTFLDAIASPRSERDRGPAWEVWTASTRVERARELCARRLGLATDEVLGMGSEGVVLQAGHRVVKVFDLWSDADRAEHLGKIHHLQRHPVRAALPRILAVHELPEAIVTIAAHTPSTAYEGGHGRLIVALLRDLHESGWAHTNIHPKNLRVTARGLTLVDVGRSLAPVMPDHEASMARRALLACRFAGHADLGALMRRSIDETDFPEIVGWEHVLEAVRSPSPKHRLDAALVDLVTSWRPSRILDYGCGKPRDVPELTRDRAMVVFDPDASLRPRWAEEAPGVPFLDERALGERLDRGEVVDLLVCSLVLCTVDDDEARKALGRIRALVDASGIVLVAVCDPTSHRVSATTYQERIDAGSLPYDASGRYTKRVEGAATHRVEHHRSLAAYRRAFAHAGLAMISERTIDGVDVDRFERVPEFVIFELRPLPSIGARTTLLVKTCALEAETIRAQVEHIVQQLGAPRAFDEVVLLVDPFDGPFPRAHSPGDPLLLRTEAIALTEAGLVDRVALGPRDGDDARRIAERWFGLPAVYAHSDNGQPLLAFLDAVQHASGDLVFHADADLMIARPDSSFDVIADALAAFEADPLAVALTLPVRCDTDPEIRTGDSRGPYRVESRAGWIHRGRLSALRPLPNHLHEGRLALPWHRALDLAVREGRAHSLRRGSHAIWCVCPDNARKGSTSAHLLLLDRVEKGVAPSCHVRRMEMIGTLAAWLGPKRDEPMILVICGRNVPAGRIHRCLDSVTAQLDTTWGAVVIDDASDDGARETLRRAVAKLGSRVTFLAQRRRRGLLANTTLAVRDICTNPESVIVLVDLDDALGTRDTLPLVCAAYEAGADVTVGSMVRTDKETRYAVDFTDPRASRGGNVWQHLRTFRKALFDRLEIGDLKLDGAWVDPPSDWAMMVPIVEMARHPTWMTRPLYLHEPSGARTPEARTARDAIIARVLARPSYRSAARAHRLRPREVVVLCYHHIADGDAGALSAYRRRGMVVSRGSFEAQMRALARAFEPITRLDLAAAARDERALPERPALVTIDDGYRDLADVALPILERTGIPAVAFARVPGEGGLPSWAPLDLLYHVLATANIDVAEALPRDAREALLDRPYAAQIEDALSLARRLDIDAAMFDAATLYLDDRSLRALPASGIALAAHGTEHVRWTTLTDEQLDLAAAKSAAWLSSIDARAPLAIAYPDAASNARVARAAAGAGFLLGFGLERPAPEVDERMFLRRWIANDDPHWINHISAAADTDAER